MFINPFTPNDYHQLRQMGIPESKVLQELETFHRGFPFAVLERPCTLNDGIIPLPESETEALAAIYNPEAAEGRTMKFVPASGAATRMFSFLQSFANRFQSFDRRTLEEQSALSDDGRQTREFFERMKDFAFYEDLRDCLKQHNVALETWMDEQRYADILRYVLTEAGLNYSNLPKALIRFHKYVAHARTAMEEHLTEAVNYVYDRHLRARIHFTLSREHETAFRQALEAVRHLYELNGKRLEVTISFQETSSNTIAVNPDNTPFRDTDGRLVFRPGGHGTLINNLNELKGDIVFIKNIDNVVPDHLKPMTYRYKKALGGLLLKYQSAIFNYLKRMDENPASTELTDQIINALENEWHLYVPQDLRTADTTIKMRRLHQFLNRPIRVCGMVKNEGEPGGGPFWVRNHDGQLSCQIIEQSQVDIENPEQKKIWESSTHFNPVDLVCGVKDYKGNHFHLPDFVDPDTGFISIKSKDGKKLKALEVPGLWNGAMAKWITIFVEVPLLTFNPVKIINDLLRDEHQLPKTFNSQFNTNNI